MPKKSKPRHATNIELMKWFIQGNGCCLNTIDCIIWVSHDFDYDDAALPCAGEIRVRNWYDKEWHEPTVDYMGLEN